MSVVSAIKSHKKISIAAAIFGILLIAVVSMMASHKIAPVSWGLWADIANNDGIAIDGYDAVAYHTENMAAKGNAEHVFQWQDARWHFANAENKALFMADPQKYAPQCGGYCAYAVSNGFTAASNPESWLIEDGKLYLLVDDDVKASWISERDQGVASKANQNWRDR